QPTGGARQTERRLSFGPAGSTIGPNRGVSFGITTDRSGSVEVYSGIGLLTELITGQPEYDAARGLRTAVFISGYEGSPLGGLDMALARHQRVRAGGAIVHRPAVNEE